MKETKEMKVLFERIAESMISNSEAFILGKAEQLCKESVERRLGEYRHELIMVEANLSSKISAIDAKL